MLSQALEVLEDEGDSRYRVIGDFMLDGLASFLFDETPAGDSDSCFPVEVVGNADAASA